MHHPAGIQIASRYGMGTDRFSELMTERVRRILLVASPYDAFALEEDGQITELLSREYRNLDLSMRYTPRFFRAQNAPEAFQILEKRPIDLICTTPRVAESTLEEFADEIHSRFPGKPIGVLAAHAWDLPRLESLRHQRTVDWVFLWQGDVKSLLAMVKQVEDHRNAPHDIARGVQAIIVVEDEVRNYSAFLPMIYSEITSHAGRLMSEGMNLSHRLLRNRARPKILLAQTFAEAQDIFERFPESILGVISDISYPMEPQGESDPEAGLKLVQYLRERIADLPILLHSSNPDNEALAHSVNCAFLCKDSPNLLAEMRRFLVEQFGFGDFVFRLEDDTEVGRAGSLDELIEQLPLVPDESLAFHGANNHFSRWLLARSDFELAHNLRSASMAAFTSGADMRSFLMKQITDYLRQIRRHVISDFVVERYDNYVAFAKIGSGSLGGKGRGLAFMHKLLAQESPRIDDIDIAIPQSVVLAADVFEEFFDSNCLRPVMHEAENMSDEEILDAFRRGRFEHVRRAQLARLLQVLRGPIAVRSSSILEDSIYQPFAGVYRTLMLPNTHPSLDVRLCQLLEAIKVVYASTYFSGARDYLRATPHRVEEERMPVLIQRVVGSARGNRFYPTFSGVALSHNFYPVGEMTSDDGVAHIAMGLGKSVVEGRGALRFCPRYPTLLPQFPDVRSRLENAQRTFWALDLKRNDIIPSDHEVQTMTELRVADGVADSAARPLVSTWREEEGMLLTGLLHGGEPIVTFEQILNGQLFPLGKVVNELLDMAREGLGGPVEMEFAVDLKTDRRQRKTFNILQVRPMVLSSPGTEVDIDEDHVESSLIYSEEALGNGRTPSIRDIIMVDPSMLERGQTRAAAAAIEAFNNHLREQELAYLLIGPGRWGSRDPWLGLPVTWPQISSAAAIVESDLPGQTVSPSEGSHFFHNLICFGITYMTVNEANGQGRVDWQRLRSLERVEEALNGTVIHLKLPADLQVLVDGSSGRGVVLTADSAIKGARN